MKTVAQDCVHEMKCSSVLEILASLSAEKFLVRRADKFNGTRSIQQDTQRAVLEEHEARDVVA